MLLWRQKLPFHYSTTVMRPQKKDNKKPQPEIRPNFKRPKRRYKTKTIKL